MGGLTGGGGSPEPPEEDPAVKAARERERKRAEAERKRELQEQLRTETSILSSRGSGGQQSLLTRGTQGFSLGGARKQLGGTQS
jgi:hypothetical protein